MGSLLPQTFGRLRSCVANLALRKTQAKIWLTLVCFWCEFFKQKLPSGHTRVSQMEAESDFPKDLLFNWQRLASKRAD